MNADWSRWHEGREARAFNEGSDARVWGVPLGRNPYLLRAEETVLRRSWEAGWLHVEAQYAVGVRGRWAYRELPLVVG